MYPDLWPRRLGLTFVTCAPGVIIMGADTKIDESGDYVRGPVNLGSIDQNSAFFAGSVYALFSPSAVPNPAAMLQQLAADVTGVGPGKSLINKVALAQTYYAVPDVQATCAVLTGFLAEVSAQRDKKIANDLADKLSADAQAIKAAIECK